MIEKTAIWLTLATKGTLSHTWTSIGPCGFYKAHNGIQKGPIHCLVISIDRLTPIWLYVITKGTPAQFFWPKNQYFSSLGPLISCWPSKGIQQGPIHCGVLNTDRLTLV